MASIRLAASSARYSRWGRRAVTMSRCHTPLVCVTVVRQSLRAVWYAVSLHRYVCFRFLETSSELLLKFTREQKLGCFQGVMIKHEDE
jgi:hypothetical protein